MKKNQVIVVVRTPDSLERTPGLSRKCANKLRKDTHIGILRNPGLISGIPLRESGVSKFNEAWLWYVICNVIWRYFVPCDGIWWMTLENNSVPLLYYTKLCASFQIHRWSQTWVTFRKRSIRVKIDNFLSCVTLKFDGGPWKTIGHPSYAASRFVHHFIAFGEFKLESHGQFGSKSTIVFSRVALKFDGWHWKQWGTSSKQHQVLWIISLPYVADWPSALDIQIDIDKVYIR